MSSPAIVKRANGRRHLSISGNNSVAVFEIGNHQLTVNISDVTIKNGNAPSGGAIHNFGTLNLTNSVLSGNSAGYGGGAVYNDGKLTAAAFFRTT